MNTVFWAVYTIVLDSVTKVRGLVMFQSSSDSV